MKSFKKTGLTAGYKDERHKHNDAKSEFSKQHHLTLREIEVLDELARGKTNKEIALTLSLSMKCIEHHLHNLYVKLNVKSRTKAILRAFTEGFVAKP